jgi:hypothetical protein
MCQSSYLLHRCRRTRIARNDLHAEAWRTVVLNCWAAAVRYGFAGLDGVSWSDRPAQRNPHKRKR